MSIRSATFKQLNDIKRRNLAITLLIINGFIALVGVILALQALQKGPVSLVSTITASRPFFVVVFALILSRASPEFLEWQPGRGMLAIRIMATVMIVAGIAVIYLT